jgi:hypothetical protein
MEDELDDTIIHLQVKCLLAHIDESEGELPPESGIHKTSRDEYAPATIRRSCPYGGGKIRRQLYPF